MPEIVSALRAHRSVVVQAAPGAGKTTRVPPALLDAGLAGKGRVVVLEPRRLAARSVARRIADERGAQLGEEVGYQVRFDRQMTEATRLCVITEGLLGRWLSTDPYLESVGVLVIDEFHERSIHTDFAFAAAREIVGVRDDFHLVVMSATIDDDAVSSALDCPAVRAPGRTHPLEVLWRPRTDDDLPRALVDAVRELCEDDEDDGGDILAFLPGAREIDACAAATKSIGGLDVHRLYSALPSAEQEAALAGRGRRRLILATNIAETSLTVPRVTAVIDSGLARVPRQDSSTGFDLLETRPISRASADQRAGRAGRIAPGRAVRLWSSHEHDRRQAYDVPEIRRIDLAPAILAAVAWSGGDPGALRWFDPPPEAPLGAALRTLEAIGLMEPSFSLTSVGRQAVELPLHPRVARFLLEARQRGVGGIAHVVAAVIAEGTHREREVEPTRADPLTVARSLTLQRSGTLGRVVRQLERAVPTPGGTDSEDAILDSIALGWADRLGFRRAQGRYALVDGGSVVLGPECDIGSPEVIVVLRQFGTRRVAGVDCGVVRMASTLDSASLPRLFPGRVRQRVRVEFSAELQRIIARREHVVDDFVISDEPTDVGTSGLDPAEIAAIFAAAVVQTPGLLAPTQEDWQFLHRLDFVRATCPDLSVPEPLEDPEFLRLVLWGRQTLGEVRREGLASLVSSQLDYAVVQAMGTVAPERLPVPSGSRIRVDYSSDPPVLAVRIQEMFGAEQTPRVGGRPVMLHLLAPNYRPAQVTSDLASFWRNTYPEVRKELRARYPKHPWPEDPLSAPAVRK